MKRTKGIIHLTVIMLLGGMLTVIGGLFLGNAGGEATAPEVPQPPAGTTVDVTLHKIANSTKTAVPNTGHKMQVTDFYEDTSKGDFDVLPGVSFAAFDISTCYYDLLAEGNYTEESAIAHLNGLNLRVDTEKLVYGPDDTEVVGAEKVENAKNETDENGEVVYEALIKFMDESDGDLRGRVYVFIETDRPAEVVTPAAPLIVKLPIQETITDEENDTEETREITDIHLYPKNQLNYGSLEVIKYVQTFKHDDKETVIGVDRETLADAQFMVHKEETDINDEETKVLSEKNEFGVRTWVAKSERTAEIFTTGKDGKLTIPYLAPGTYRLSEISDEITTDEITNEFGLNDSVLNREFTITAGGTTTTFMDNTTDLLNDDLIVDKANSGRSYDYNEPIEYTSKVTIPSGIGEKLADNNPRYTTFTLTDTFDEGLSLLVDTVQVFAGGDKLVGEEYKLTPPTTNPSNNQFVIEINNPGTTLADYGNQLLTVTYQMEIKQDATPDVDFNNTLTVTTDYDVGEDNGEEVFTGGKRFVKVDANTGNSLEGAKFIVQNKDKNQTLYKVNGKYVWSAEKPTAGEVELVTVTSGTNGEFAIQGLAYGTYYLVETKTPGTDYILPTEGFEFIIEENTFNDEGGEPVTGEKIDTIKNYTRGTLPATGMGAAPYFLIGGAGMLGIGYLVRRKKKA